MREVYLDRFYKNDKQTLGVLSTLNGSELFVAKTLELADKNNKPKISCIPVGTYICEETYSPKFNDNRYEVIDVPNRDGIRLDIANYYNQLLGCICIGSALKDINADGNLDIIHSGDTMKKFLEILNHEKFKLIIRDHLPDVNFA